MKVDQTRKIITPETWQEVFTVWGAPGDGDHDMGGYLCGPFAACRYAGCLNTKDAKDWTLEFLNYNHQQLFRGFHTAFFNRMKYFDIETGQIDHSSEGKDYNEEDPILLVAQAFSKNNNAFSARVVDDDGMPTIVFTHAGNAFNFTILEDYTMFWTFNTYLTEKLKRLRISNKQKQVHHFLESIKNL